jgi:DNA helicase-2/ATP-dependent DNA helicase PcrA
MERAGHRGADPYARLTPAQREAVFAEDQRLCVYAGAGAGKTRVLTLRAARIVEEGTNPAQLLVVTFSRKAAQELRRRLWRLGVEGVAAGTFHATALELLEVRRAELGLGPPKLISDRRRALERVAATVPGAEGRGIAAQLDTELTWAKANDIGPVDYPARATSARRRGRLRSEVVGAVFERYEQAKRRQGLTDFDDLISEASDALADPVFAAAIHWRSRHVFVDEFQDVNPAQFELVQRLVSPESSLFCVGDPNQSIYGFNGADPELLRHLPDLIEGTRVLHLDANHRSSPEIVAAANAVLPAVDRRSLESTQQAGSLPAIVAHPDDQSEADWVARRVRELRGPGGRWRSIAVLARTNAQLERFADALEARGIPAERLAPERAAGGDPRTGASGPRLEPTTRPEDAVALATFHRAKGLEWPTVFVVGVSDGFVPHSASSDERARAEERRLLYVALTRAERQLIITWSARREPDEPERAPNRLRSPFLDELERHLDERAAADRPSPGSRAASRVASIRAQLERRMSARHEDADPEASDEVEDHGRMV